MQANSPKTIDVSERSVYLNCFCVACFIGGVLFQLSLHFFQLFLLVLLLFVVGVGRVARRGYINERGLR